jgi:hypothetical protein
MRVADKQLRGAGMQYLTGGQQQAATTESPAPGKPAATQPSANPAAVTAPQTPADFAAVLAAMKDPAADYDPNVVAAFESLHVEREALKQQVAQTQAWIQQQEHARQQQAHIAELVQFEQHVKSLGMNELFGDQGYDAATPEQQQNYQAAAKAWLEIKYGQYVRDGQPAHLDAKQAKRAVYSAFPDHIKKLAKQELAQTVRKQSGTRMGGGTRATPAGPYRGPVEDDPEIVAAFEALRKDPNARLSR